MCRGAAFCAENSQFLPTREHPMIRKAIRAAGLVAGLLAGIFAGMALAGGAAVAQTALPDLSGRAVLVATQDAYPPLQYIAPISGKRAGLEYDAMNEIARRLNLAVSYETSTWDVIIGAVSQGRFDMAMSGITFTDKRAERVDFSDSYLRSDVLMLARSGEARFADPASFAATNGARIGVGGEMIAQYVAVYDVLDGDPRNERLAWFNGVDATLDALRAGRIDAAIVNGVAARQALAAPGSALRQVGEAMGVEEFRFIFPKGSDLVAPVNAAIAAMKADGTMDGLAAVWFLESPPVR
jgi:polar amino acid transport system substrate-binding protein